MSLSEKYNKGMGIARGICSTNAKLARVHDKNRRESNTETKFREALSFLLDM